MKIEISEINKIKLEAIKKNSGLENVDAVITKVISAYINVLTEEEIKKLMEVL